jgi:hypothetical protein
MIEKRSSRPHAKKAPPAAAWLAQSNPGVPSPSNAAQIMSSTVMVSGVSKVRRSKPALASTDNVNSQKYNGPY